MEEKPDGWLVCLDPIHVVLLTNTDGTLFEPSACRSGDSTHGMGLGLSICKSIVAAHGGMIEGHNAESGGAVFMIHLPKENNNEQY